MFGDHAEVVNIRECKPDHESIVKQKNKDIERFDNTLDAFYACPDCNINYKSVHTVIGAIYTAKRFAIVERDKALQELENQ